MSVLSTSKTYDELYDELLKKGAQYRAKKEWRKAASAYREAIALKVDKSIDSRGKQLNDRQAIDLEGNQPKHCLAEFRLGEAHMQLGEEPRNYFSNFFGTYFDFGEDNYEKATGTAILL